MPGGTYLLLFAPRLIRGRIMLKRMNRDRTGLKAALLCAFWLCLSAVGARAGEYTPNNVQLFRAENLDMSEWDTDKRIELVVDLPAGSGNAAALYAKLNDLYEEDRLPDAVGVKEGAKGVEVIQQAAQIRACELTPEHFEPMLDHRPDTLVPLVFLAYSRRMLERAEELEAVGKAAAAEQLLNAALIMGWHITEDRPDVVAYSLGLTLQRRALKVLEEFAFRRLDSERARACREYDKFLSGIMRKVGIKSRGLLGSWKDFASLEACRRCARQDAEPVWRREATVNLGVMQNGYPVGEDKWASDPVQQAVARKALEAVAKGDPAPSIRKLAAWCLKNLDREGIKEIREKRRTKLKQAP
jgi:hypothetical protein